MALLSGADAAEGGQVRAMPLASIAICSKPAFIRQCTVGGTHIQIAVAGKH